MVLAILVSVLVVLSSVMVILGTYVSTEPGDKATTTATTSKASTTSTTPTPTPIISVEAKGVKKFESYNELLSFIKSYLETRESASRFEETYMVKVGALGGEIPATSAPGYSAGVSTSRYSETNVQVRGVDEPDVVKTNGRILVVSSEENIYIINTTNDEVVSIITLGLGQGYTRVSGLFLSDDKLVVIAEPPMYSIWRFYISYVPSVTEWCVNTTIYVYDLANPSEPVLLGKISVSGFVVGARLVNNTIYLVTQEDIVKPVLPVVGDTPVPLAHILLLGDKPDHYIILTAIDLDSLTYSSYVFIMPPTSWLYVSHNRIYLASYMFPDYYEIQSYGLKAIARHLPEEIKVKVDECIDKKDISGAYKIITDHLRGRDESYIENLVNVVKNELRNVSFKPETVFYVFDFNKLNISYRGMFKVEGRVLDQFAMEEMGNYFVVATTSRTYVVAISYYKFTWPISYRGEENIVKITECQDGVCITKTIRVNESYYEEPRIYISIWLDSVDTTSNNVFVIDLETMNITGSLTGLAKSERIYSARLVRHIFYLVTYRRIDPLFAIDLSDPTNPKVIGFIEAPGFSEYLHPISDELLVGIGREDASLKISLYNVSDPTHIVEIAKLNIEPGWSPVFYDHHAFTIDPLYKRIYIPIRTYYSSSYHGIAVISYKNNTLRLVKILEHKDAIRTVYVDGKLYTVSHDLVKIYNIDTLEYIKSIELKVVVILD